MIQLEKPIKMNNTRCFTKQYKEEVFDFLNDIKFTKINVDKIKKTANYILEKYFN